MLIIMQIISLVKKRQKSANCQLKFLKNMIIIKIAYIGQNDLELIKIHTLFKRIDANSNGIIDLNEFRDKMANVCVVF